MARYLVYPHRDFYNDLYRQLDAQRGVLPSRDEFLEGDLYALGTHVADVWEQAPEIIPGRADYRLVEYTDITGARYAVTVWLNRVGRVLVMRHVEITPMPPESDEEDW